MLPQEYSGLIENTIEEIGWWSCFKEDKDWEDQKKQKRKTPVIVQSPHKSKAEKIGRNAPCPCGSGKKYKKCCGR